MTLRRRLKRLGERIDHLRPGPSKNGIRGAHGAELDITGFSESTRRMFGWWWVRWLGLPEARDADALGVYARFVGLNILPLAAKNRHKRVTANLDRAAGRAPRLQGLCELSVARGFIAGRGTGDEREQMSRAVAHLRAARILLHHAHGNEFDLFRTLVHLTITHAQRHDQPGAFDDAYRYGLEAEYLVERMWTFGTDECADPRYHSGIGSLLYASEGWRDLLVHCSLHLASVFMTDLGDLDRAGDMYGRLAARASARYKHTHPANIVASKLYAGVLVRQNRFADAVPVYRRVREWNRDANVFCIPCEDGLVLQNLVACLAAEGRWSDVVGEAEAADLQMQIIDGSVGCTTLAQIRAAYAHLGMDDMVLRMCEQYSDPQDAWFGEAGTITLRGLEERWAALHRLGRPAEALVVANDILNRNRTVQTEMDWRIEGDEKEEGEGEEEVSEQLPDAVDGTNLADPDTPDPDSQDATASHAPDALSIAPSAASAMSAASTAGVGGIGGAAGFGHLHIDELEELDEEMALLQGHVFGLDFDPVDCVTRPMLRERTLRAHWNVAWSLADVGELDEAAYHLHQCLAYVGGSSSSSSSSSNSRRQPRTREEAVMLRNVLCQLAYVYELQGEMDDAAAAHAHAQRALAVKPHSDAHAGWYAWHRGKMYLYSGHFREALQMFVFAKSVMRSMFEGESAREGYDAEDLFAPRPRERVPEEDPYDDHADELARFGMRRASTDRLPPRPAEPLPRRRTDMSLGMSISEASTISSYSESASPRFAPAAGLGLGGPHTGTSHTASLSSPYLPSISLPSLTLRSPSTSAFSSPNTRGGGGGSVWSSPRAPSLLAFAPTPPLPLSSPRMAPSSSCPRFTAGAETIWAAIEAAALGEIPAALSTLALRPALDPVHLGDGALAGHDLAPPVPLHHEDATLSVAEWMAQRAKWPLAARVGAAAAGDVENVVGARLKSVGDVGYAGYVRMKRDERWAREWGGR